ncbi:MAG: response regulator [Sandaracinaceae bacterium]|nr:response regulator [Sandaracinaceae bacterium]
MTLVRAAADGTVEVVAGALPGEGTLEERLAALAGCEASWISEVLEDPRRGAPAAIELDGEGGETATGRLMAWPERDGIAVLYAPRVDPATLVRRAAAADHAAGVTHEVANSLTAIAGWTRMASTSAPLPDRTRHALEVVQRSAREALESARGLLRTMRDATPGTIAPGAPEPTDSAAVVREVLETLRPEVEARGLTLSTELPEQLLGAPPPAALRLVVGNLVRNAVEALEPGGTIAVGMHRDGERFVLVIEDDGPGMSRETLERAFDRYFTTKDAGTGLGLAMVRDTVHEAGGRVEVRSQPGRGTRFEVALPLVGRAPMSMRPPRIVGAGPRSSGVRERPPLAYRAILVVDDDAAIGALVRTALELHGAFVEVATSPAAALERAEQRRFDLAIVDLGLGDHRGDALLRVLRERDAIDRALVMTGSADVQLDDGVADALLTKPFELAELHRVVEELLGDEDDRDAVSSSS